eukprot:194033-Hanusia_phi.AAC.1
MHQVSEPTRTCDYSGLKIKYNLNNSKRDLFPQGSESQRAWRWGGGARREREEEEEEEEEEEDYDGMVRPSKLLLIEDRAAQPPPPCELTRWLSQVFRAMLLTRASFILLLSCSCHAFTLLHAPTQVRGISSKRLAQGARPPLAAPRCSKLSMSVSLDSSQFDKGDANPIDSIEVSMSILLCLHTPILPHPFDLFSLPLHYLPTCCASVPPTSRLSSSPFFDMMTS